MSGVARFMLDERNGECWMEADSHGPYVRHSDYAAVVAERDEWRKKAFDIAHHVAGYIYSCGGIPCRCGFCERDLMSDGSGHDEGCIAAEAKAIIDAHQEALKAKHGQSTIKISVTTKED